MRIAVISVAVTAAWLSIRHYNNGGFGNNGGGHGGGHNHGNGPSGSGNPNSSSMASVLTDDEKKKKSNMRPIHLTLVSFAVTRKAYEVITAKFAEEYEAQTGVPVKFRLSFGGSGTQV